MKPNYDSPHHSSCTHKTFSQNCSRSEQSVADNGQQSMNGDWNPSNSLKKTWGGISLWQSEYRGKGIKVNGIFEGSKVGRGREIGPLGF